VGARQLTLAGEVAGLRGARRCPGWFPAAAGVVPGGGRHGYELSGGQRAADGAGRLLILQPHIETLDSGLVMEPAGACLVAAPPA
jgi:hypothetical protein